MGGCLTICDLPLSEQWVFPLTTDRPGMICGCVWLKFIV